MWLPQFFPALYSCASPRTTMTTNVAVAANVDGLQCEVSARALAQCHGRELLHGHEGPARRLTKLASCRTNSKDTLT